jgi:hypothetical protein
MPMKPTRSRPNAKERRGKSALASIARSLVSVRHAKLRARLPLTPAPGQNLSCQIIVAWARLACKPGFRNLPAVVASCSLYLICGCRGRQNG